jgi:hypothetical protein
MSVVEDVFDFLDVQVDKGLRAIDPDLSSTADKGNQPAPATPTEGPNRLTIRVPSYATKFNLGERETGSATSDPGITAETESHQHFFTFGGEEDEVTVVRIGKPAESVKTEDASTDELVFEKVRRIPELVDAVKKEVQKGPKQLLRERIQATREEVAQLKRQLAEEEASLKQAKDNRAERYTILETRKKIKRLKQQIQAVVTAPIQPLLDLQEKLQQELRPVTTRLEYPAPGSHAIGSIYNEAVRNWNGYAMVTQGGAYSESQHNYVIASASGEVRVAAEQAVALGSPGDVIIGADVLATVSDLTENDGDPTLYDEPGRVATYFSLELKTGIFALQTAITRSIMGIAGLLTLQHKPSDGKTGWDIDKSSYGFMLMDLVFTQRYVAKALSAWGSLALGVRERNQGFGNVGIFGSSTVTIVSRLDAHVYAHKQTTISAGYKVAVSGLKASMSGLIGASMDGLSAKVIGLKTAAMKSHFGAAEVKGWKDATIASTSGTVHATGKKNVQVNSTDGKVNVHGTQGFYLGAGGASGPPDAGLLAALAAAVTNPVATFKSFTPVPIIHPPGKGFAIQGTDSQLLLAPAATANQFDTPTFDPTHMIRMKQDATLLLLKDSVMKMQPDQTVLASKTLNLKGIKGGNVNVEGKDINVKARGKIFLG